MYKAGDIIRIKKDLQTGPEYDVVSDMLQYAGQIATIYEVYEDDDLIVYFLAINGERIPWNWRSAIFDKIDKVSPDSFYNALMKEE